MVDVSSIDKEVIRVSDVRHGYYELSVIPKIFPRAIEEHPDIIGMLHELARSDYINLQIQPEGFGIRANNIVAEFAEPFNLSPINVDAHDGLCHLAYRLMEPIVVLGVAGADAPHIKHVFIFALPRNPSDAILKSLALQALNNIFTLHLGFCAPNFFFLNNDQKPFHAAPIFKSLVPWINKDIIIPRM